MLQHIDTDHGVKAGGIIGQGRAQADIVPDPQATGTRVGAGDVDGVFGGIDSGHLRLAPRASPAPRP